MIVLHADLPALEAADVEALIEAASEAGAIAPDHRGSGTNALALLNARDFPFCFGPDSFARHCALLPGCGTVRRPGLARDIDLPEDLPWAAALGCLPSSL